MRTRSTAYETSLRRYALWEIVCEIQPCTVRQVFYQATVRGVVEKTERAYDMVQRDLVLLRRDQNFPYSFIVDNTRVQRRPQTYDSLQDGLRRFSDYFRLDVFSRLPVYVEVWLEKDALSGVVVASTAKYDVPLMVARGYSSLSFLHSAGEAIEAQSKPTYIYHLGDWDPSGQDAARNIEERLREFAPNTEIHFERLAVNAEQIDKWSLPSRPTKQTDSRAASWRGGDSVEMDAIHPQALRDLVTAAIVQHIPTGHLDEIAREENAAKEIMAAMRLAP